MATFTELAQQAETYVEQDRLPKIDKRELEGRPFIVTGYSLKSGTAPDGRPTRYVLVNIVIDTDEMTCFADGGAVIPAILQAQETFPLMVAGGLRLGQNGRTWLFS